MWLAEYELIGLEVTASRDLARAHSHFRQIWWCTAGSCRIFALDDLDRVKQAFFGYTLNGVDHTTYVDMTIILANFNRGGGGKTTKETK